MNKVTFPLKHSTKGPEVAGLQDVLQLFLERQIFGKDAELPTKLASELMRERKAETFGDVTQKLVEVFQEGHDLKVSGSIDAKTAAAMNAILHKWGLLDPKDDPPATGRQLAGQVVFEYGLPAEQLTLRLYRHDFGGSATRLAETTSVADGHYTFTYDAGGRALSLEVRAVDAEGKETSLSKLIHDLPGEAETALNLVAPAALRPLAAEYTQLVGDLKPLVGDLKNLASAKETAESKDLTILHNSSGWDARLLAFAVTAQRLSADDELDLSGEALYGLLRAGLPSDKQLLAEVTPELAERALRKVRDAGIVALDDQALAQVRQQFTAFTNRMRLSATLPGSHTTYAEMLKASGLNEEDQAKFAAVYFDRASSPEVLWDNVRKAGIDDVHINRLQLQGKLAFLTGGSAALTTSIQQRLNTDDPVQLVDLDLHRPSAWIEAIHTAAGISANSAGELAEDAKKQLEALVPPVVSGATIEARRDAWAEDMARTVRLSYPTQVVARTLELDGADTFGLGAAREKTVKLLKKAAEQGFQLGQTPVASFLKAHAGLQDGVDAAEFSTIEKHVLALQRVYQITPNDEAMPVLSALGMTSAYDVTAYEESEFTALYAAKYHDLYKVASANTVPSLVYRKAQQVSSVTSNVVGIIKKLNSELTVYGLSGSSEMRESVKNELIKHFPTMESLFGSMDYCECEHCRSVLSPAAYLVDILQFVDAEPQVWENFLSNWKKTHGNQEYTAKYRNPYDELIARRPDLPHIPLTCENTNTALPYIDLVNEILEYYVAHDKLEAATARDTGDATTPELLAEPHNIIREAYDKVRAARYPLTLPFDLWIETVRAFCNAFEVPLHRVLETLRTQDDLFAPGQTHDRAAVFLESLGLGPAEVAIFADPDPLASERWHELYGLDGFEPIRAAIQNPTNHVNATLSIANDEAGKLRDGLFFTFLDVGANTQSPESKPLATIGAADSGGAGLTLLTLKGIWTVAPKAGDVLVCDVPSLLRSGKALSRRLDVSYAQLIELVQTAFINPQLDQLVLLNKLGVSISSVRFCRDAQNKALYDQNQDLLQPALSPGQRAPRKRATLSAAEQASFRCPVTA